MVIKAKDPTQKGNKGVTSSKVEGAGDDPDRQGLDVYIIGGLTLDVDIDPADIVDVSALATAANQTSILNALNNLEIMGTLTEKAIKAGYDESDIIDNKITINEALGTMNGIIARNNSTTNTLTLTINSISVVLSAKGVDANNIPNDYKFYGSFDPFSEIEVAGTSPDFDIYVEG